MKKYLHLIYFITRGKITYLVSQIDDLGEYILFSVHMQVLI